MSRARGPSIVHAVADNLDQAIEDISHDWLRRTQPAMDHPHGATAASTRPFVSCPRIPAAKRARLVAELAALDRLGPPSVRADLAAARTGPRPAPPGSPRPRPWDRSVGPDPGGPSRPPARQGASRAPIRRTPRPTRQWGDVNGTTGVASPESLRQPKPAPSGTGPRTAKPAAETLDRRIAPSRAPRRRSREPGSVPPPAGSTSTPTSPAASSTSNESSSDSTTRSAPSCSTDSVPSATAIHRRRPERRSETTSPRSVNVLTDYSKSAASNLRASRCNGRSAREPGPRRDSQPARGRRQSQV